MDWNSALASLSLPRSSSTCTQFLMCAQGGLSWQSEDVNWWWQDEETSEALLLLDLRQHRRCNAEWNYSYACLYVLYASLRLVFMPRSQPYWRAFVASHLITQWMGWWGRREMCSQSDCEKSNNIGEYAGEQPNSKCTRSSTQRFTALCWQINLRPGHHYLYT